MKFKLVVTGVLLLVIGLVFLDIREPDAWPITKDDSHPVDSQGGVPLGLAGSSGYSDPGLGMPAWVEEDYRQVYTVIDYRDVEVVDFTRDPQSGVWSQDLYAESTALDIASVCSNGADRYFFAEDAGLGETRIIRWELKKRKVSQVSPPPGQLPKVWKKQELYQGVIPTPVVSIAADPEERFLMILAGPSSSRALFMLSLANPVLQAPILSAQQQPVLQTAETLSRFGHQYLGRLWLLSCRPDVSMSCILFTDQDNDGIFDGSPIVGDYHALRVSGELDNHYLQHFDGIW